MIRAVSTIPIDPARGPARPRTPRIALAHDWLCGYRGGEAVLERIAALIARRYEPANLYTMFSDGRALTPAVDGMRRVVARLGRMPGASTKLRRWLLPLYPRAVAELSRALAADHRRQPIDLLISTSSAAIKGLRPPPGVPHLCYCHAPARYVWSRMEDYTRTGTLRGLGLRLLGTRFKAWDLATAGHVTGFLANSRYTADQILRCYQRPAEVVYPPVRTELFTPDSSVRRGDFWLVVSALEPYKRIDVAVEAANLQRRALVIAGSGSERRRLESIAGPTVRFLGRVDDAELVRLYRTAALLICPQVEDFGITAVEAQACGLPVVSRGAGGALETVIGGRTGAFYEEAAPESLLEAIAAVPADCANACRENALRFSEPAFDAAMQRGVDEALEAKRTANNEQRT
jgi:glycosyltransferase involved in cell wall biosynthesis